jgi:hypothetical protein
MLQVKVVINHKGKLLTLEDFPDDETHWGLHDMLPGIEECEYEEPPGIYLAECVVESNASFNPFFDDTDAYLEVVKLTKIADV